MNLHNILSINGIDIDEYLGGGGSEEINEIKQNTFNLNSVVNDLSLYPSSICHYEDSRFTKYVIDKFPNNWFSYNYTNIFYAETVNINSESFINNFKLLNSVYNIRNNEMLVVSNSSINQLHLELQYLIEYINLLSSNIISDIINNITTYTFNTFVITEVYNPSHFSHYNYYPYYCNDYCYINLIISNYHTYTNYSENIMLEYLTIPNIFISLVNSATEDINNACFNKNTSFTNLTISIYTNFYDEKSFKCSYLFNNCNCNNLNLIIDSLDCEYLLSDCTVSTLNISGTVKYINNSHTHINNCSITDLILYNRYHFTNCNIINCTIIENSYIVNTVFNSCIINNLHLTTCMNGIDWNSEFAISCTINYVTFNFNSSTKFNNKYCIKLNSCSIDKLYLNNSACNTETDYNFLQNCTVKSVYYYNNLQSSLVKKFLGLTYNAAYIATSTIEI